MASFVDMDDPTKIVADPSTVTALDALVLIKRGATVADDMLYQLRIGDLFEAVASMDYVRVDGTFPMTALLVGPGIQNQTGQSIELFDGDILINGADVSVSQNLIVNGVIYGNASGLNAIPAGALAGQVPVISGGTGATTAAGARTNLGVPAGSGTSTGTNTGDQSLAAYITTVTAVANFQPIDSDLTAIAALATTPFGRALLTQADAATARATIGASNVTASTGLSDTANIARLNATQTFTGTNTFPGLTLTGNIFPPNQLAIGQFATATGASTALAFGYGSNSSGSNGIAIGNTAYATGGASVAIGTSTVASGANSMALGNAASCTFDSSAAVGGGVALAMREFAYGAINGTSAASTYRLTGYSSTQPRSLVTLESVWLDSTDAVRRAGFHLRANDAANPVTGRTVMSGGTDGSNPTIGLLGATPVARQTLAAAATDAASTMALVNSIRTALINLGACQ